VRILLIEDDPDDADLVKSLLEETGVATNVVNERLLTLGLRRLASEEFDLVFLDLSLPDSWGMDTLRRLHKPFPRLPIVLMTGARVAEIAEEAKREGAAACLFKQDLDASRLAEILAEIRTA
jgi:CheY-like chemotaxis protein